VSAFKELDPEIAFKAIEGFTDELESESTALEAFYRQFSCPWGCGSLHKETDIRHAFSDPDTLVPRSLLRCGLCRHLVDPHSGVVLEKGGVANPLTASK